jgi:hypothetical protein
MRRPDPEQMSVDQLVARFADIGVEQDDAILKDDNRRFRRLYRGMDDIEKELQLRPGDQRRALMALYRHANMQVRLNAAKATLAVAPEQARAMLESIAASSWQPQAGDAGMTLSNLDRGIFKPT